MATKEAPKPRVEGTAAAVRKRNQAIAAAQSFSREGFINQRRSQRSVRAHTLFVGNLDLRATEHTVLQLFKPFGKVKDLDFKFHRGGTRRGEPKGYCFVEMATAAGARAAKEELNGVAVGRRPVVVIPSVTLLEGHQGIFPEAQITTPHGRHIMSRAYTVTLQNNGSHLST